MEINNIENHTIIHTYLPLGIKVARYCNFQGIKTLYIMSTIMSVTLRIDLVTEFT